MGGYVGKEEISWKILTQKYNQSVGGHGTTTRKLHYMYAYKNIWNGISNGKYKLSLNVSISCIDISGLLGDTFKILHMNTLAYCMYHVQVLLYRFHFCQDIP